MPPIPSSSLPGLLLLLGSRSEGSSTLFWLRSGVHTASVRLSKLREKSPKKPSTFPLYTGRRSLKACSQFGNFWFPVLNLRPDSIGRNWARPIESIGRPGFDRSDLGGVFWFFCRSWFCPIEPRFNRSTRSIDLVLIGQICQALLLLLCRCILSDRDGLARSTRSFEAKFVRSTLFFSVL